MTVCASAVDGIMTEGPSLLLTKYCEQTCHMTKTQVNLTSSRKRTRTAPSRDCRPRSAQTKKAPKPSKTARRKRVNATPVPPAELLLDDMGTLAVAVGDKAVPVAALGATEWPLPEELLLLLEPELQQEVLAEVGPGVR